MTRKPFFCAIVLLLLPCAFAQAALLSRLSGQAYYDTDLNITWLADANLAASNSFGIYFTRNDGIINWHTAQAWIAAMNGANYLGVSDWRLPRILDTGPPGCEFAYNSTDCGYNVTPSTGEMAHLFYVTLANEAAFDTSGTKQPCFDLPTPGCLTNPGPFANLAPRANNFWSGNEYALNNNEAWAFYFRLGYQNHIVKTNIYNAWPVRDGDIGAVPIPAAAWLIGPAFGLLAPWTKRRQATA